ncbi:MAG: AmmeMemoRadiSam system protein A, partial [Firmicutes bacterium]|nr:AmmeMemoRadiSam system protein A [Bacillota bacterium]
VGERDAELDHGTMVPLWFIRQYYNEFKLVRVGLSGLPLTDHYLLGQLIREAVDETGKRVVFVASGDLSHKLQPHGPYGFAPEGPQYDARIMDVCGRADFGELLDFDEAFCERAAECGHRSFTIMAGVWDGTAVRASVLSHEDVTGVGYGICTFYPEGPDGDRHFLDQHMQRLAGELSARKSGEDAWVSLARESLEAYVIRRETIDVPQGLPAELLERRTGAFVSLHEHGQLRGCIGTIAPTTDCLAREIIQNAVSACSRDPRFMPVRREELPWLEISVDVLGEAEDISSMDQLDVKRYGVIVSRGGRRGLLLPDLDGVDTVEQQVSIARQKAGIAPNEKVSLQRFEVVRHS